ncbi:GntR family transcriptional regulator [Xinfangfangia sp. CPCC 101601]|uniref:GntR family transcriptional regulator n=1 Tax=Pseudogemmobacter lacusdianii TaxID=3069608 RepID=A0ABU0W017_9RHOB|nr:GntR family transcriptional regulator [Xinfangfangia sp. CPCC 101601]MDQ2067304.1 GntR family transcriptional regulator [Xinfangfangia sp. CPCC 101601]
MSGSSDTTETAGAVNPPAQALAAVTLDPYSGEQIYRQLYRGLQGLILSGVWREGDMMPSENEMRDHFQIARTTVRHAFSLLVSEGLVRQVRGKGSIVTHRPVTHSVWNFGSFTDLARSRGKRPVTRVLEHRVEDGCLILVRARGLEDPAGGEAVDWLNLDHSRLSVLRHPGIEDYDFASQSLYAVLLRDYGRTPVRAEVKLSILPPSPRLLEVFGTDDGVPGYLCASGEVLDAAGEAIEQTSIVYSPRIEMKFATRWGGAEPRHSFSKGDENV